MKAANDIRLISGSSNTVIAQKIAKILGEDLTPIEISKFKDGEIYVQIKDSIRGKDVFVIQSTSKDVNNNLMELSIIIDALKRASAKRITAVMPYFGYARQDRKAKPREPITAKLVANILVAAGADRILTMDLHADQIEGFFEIPVDHLRSVKTFAEWVKNQAVNDLVVVAPDAGAAKKTRKLAEKLNAPLAIVDKRREKTNMMAESTVVGKVEGKNCILIDDMIDSGGTILSAAKALKEKGAKKVYLLATHGIFSEPALERMRDLSIEKVVITDTINQEGRDLPEKIHVESVAGIFAEAIKLIHKDESVEGVFRLVKEKEHSRLENF